MITLDQWAARWNIPPAAMRELKQAMNVSTDTKGQLTGPSETATQNQIRLAASKHGVRLLRNNVGAMYDSTGRLVRYGLANESARVAKKIKSSDLIGITPYIVRPENVGQTLGIFTAVEVKKGGWVFTGTGREQPQFEFIKLVQSLGGRACFATCPRDAGY